MVECKTDNEFVYWNYIDVRIPLDKINSKLFFRETISPRLRNEFQDMDVVVLRSELGYKNSDWLKSSLGYDWFRRFNSTSDYENRIWQQFYLEKYNFFTRLRLEERFIENADMVIRFRTMIGYEYKISKNYSLTLSDEIFLNLNDEAGLQQNRVLLALSKKINDNLKVSLGYQLQHFFMDLDLINHGIVTRFQVDF